MTDNQFRNAWQKVERAEKHIQDFDIEIKAFNASDPYEMVIEKDTDTGYLVIKVRRLKHPPDNLTMIVCDAIHNLRSALDYLACDLALRNGKDTKQVYFPFAKTEEIFNSDNVQKKMRKFSAEDQASICALEPYLGGKGELLFALHALNIVEKHIKIVPIGPTGSKLNVRPKMGPKMADKMRIYKLSPFDDRDEIPIVAFPPGANFEGHIEPSINLTFAEPQPVKGEPVGGTLQYFLKTVSSIIGSFER